MANAMQGFWSRLTPRERTYILVLVLVFFLMSTLVLLYLRAGALRDTRNEIDEVRMALDQVYTRGSIYEAKLEAKKAREANISSDKLLFATLLEEAKTGLENISISGEEEDTKPLDLGGGLVKRTFRFEIRAVPLEELLKFLTALESKPGHVVVVDGLLVRSTNETEDRLNVDVTLSTWERREVAAEAPAEGAAAAEEARP